MLSSLLSKFLASLLVSVLCGAIITTVMSQTLLNAQYIEGRLTAINGYSRLSAALTQEVGQEAGVANNPEVDTELRGILTPAALKQKINGALNQLQEYYEGKVPAPTINLNDLASQAQAQGIPVEQTPTLTQPIMLAGGSTQTTQTKNVDVAKTFDHVRTATILTAIVLIVALLAVSWKRHRYGALPGVLMSVGVLMGIVALVFDLAPSLADRYIKFSATSNAFTSIGRDLAENIAHDLGRRFAIIAVTSFVVGLIVRIVAGRLPSLKVSLSQKPSTATS
jgi:hypothetical protein